MGVGQRRQGVGRALATVAGVALAVAFVAGGVPATAGPGSGHGGSPDPGGVLASAAPFGDHDAVTVTIDVARNGSARWSVTYAYELPNESARERFRRGVRNLPDRPYGFIEDMRTEAVPVAERRTGREMEVGLGERTADTSLGEAVRGTVTYEFTWTNFVDDRGDRVVVGDAISGIDFGRRESVTVAWTDSFRRVSASPPPDASDRNEVEWNHPLGFGSDDPRVELARTGGGPGLPLAAAAVAAVALVAVAGWVGRSRLRAAGDDGAEEGDDGELAAVPSEDLVTDEERVLRLVEANGGRMRQADLVEAVEWSRTKTSDVVNEMHEAGQVELYQLGRENVLALPGEIEI
jgi:hypothetical protein